MACRKKCYENRGEAKRVKRLLNHDKGYALTDIYYCGECSNYHLTSMNKKQSRKKKRA